MKLRSAVVLLCVVLAAAVASAQRPAPDTIPAAGGDITIVPISHASVYIAHGQHVILVDPVRFGPAHPSPPPSPEELAQVRKIPRQPVGDPPAEATSAVLAMRPEQMAHFNGLRPPMIILVTDIHDDHLDGRAIGALKTPTTGVIVPSAAMTRLLGVQGAEAMVNGETKSISGITIEAVPMYNLRPDPQFGVVLHPKGRGNGYVVTIGGKRLYVAGDTACTPEMKALKNIDVAFLPMNLPFTMPPSEAAECATAFKPGIVYPYHYFESDPKAFESALKGSGIDVRLRDWYIGGQTASK
jgi:L-ascorbate metabolism protein UlaG (beta-lactamase superfamily)